MAAFRPLRAITDPAGWVAAPQRTWDGRSAGNPAPGLVQLIHLEDLVLARHRPGEQAHRIGHPADAGDDGQPLPGRAIPELDAESGLHVLDPGLWLQPGEVWQDEQAPGLP